MENKKKYTVAEYAELKGISPQAVYKQIKKNKLTGKIIIENDTTYILVDDTEQLNHKQPTDNQPLNQPTNQNNDDLPLRGNNKEQPTSDNQPLNQNTTNQQPTDNQDTTTSHLNRIIDILENQLKEKDKQIAEKDKQIIALTERLKENNFIQSQNKIQMIESKTTNGKAKRKEHRGIFARFRKERLHTDNTEEL